jgi:dTDP-4-dehydrorhamnose 3,5-epimerase
MKVRPTKIAGVSIVDGPRFRDHRGSFARLYCERELSDLLGERRVVQVNLSRTTEVGAVRGLHAQRAPYAEMKLVRCLRGRVWDVTVDARRGSPTFLAWHAEELSAHNNRMVVVPEGCAHGFQALEPDSELLYLHTAFYTPEAELGIRVDDARLGIRWPLPMSDLSDRDRRHPLLADDFAGIRIAS